MLLAVVRMVEPSKECLLEASSSAWLGTLDIAKSERVGGSLGGTRVEEEDGCRLQVSVLRAALGESKPNVMCTDRENWTFEGTFEGTTETEKLRWVGGFGNGAGERNGWETVIDAKEAQGTQKISEWGNGNVVVRIGRQKARECIDMPGRRW